MNEGTPLYALAPLPSLGGQETQCLFCHQPISGCTCTKPRDLTICLVCGQPGPRCTCPLEEDV